MFTGYKAGPFAPGVHDISREAPKTFLPARAGRPPEVVNAGLLSALGGGDIPEPPIDAAHDHAPEGARGVDCKRRQIR